MEFHDYEVKNTDQFTSDFLNQVSTDFTDNMVKLYTEYKDLIAKYDNYRNSLNAGIDWLTTQVSSLSIGTYAITGFSTPVSVSNLTQTKLFGEFYLEEQDSQSKIGRYINEFGKEVAYNSTKVYKFDTGTSSWGEDATIKKIIDSHGDIWMTTDVNSEMYIAVATSDISVDKKANIIDVYPFAGTLIKTIEWKTPSGGFELVTVNSRLPVRLVGSFDFSNELRIKMEGVLTGGVYRYSLRYVDVYRSDFKDEGRATFTIGSWDTITSIDLNSDYIEDDLKPKRPVRIEVLSNDESIIYYDSNSDPFPLQSSINIDVIPQPIRMRLTLYKTEGKTPIIKYVEVQ